MAENQFSNVHVREFFTELSTKIAALPAGERRGFLLRQRGVFERHEARLLTWAQSGDGSNPFNPPLTAMDCSIIVLELSRLVHSQTEQQEAA